MEEMSTTCETPDNGCTILVTKEPSPSLPWLWRTKPRARHSGTAVTYGKLPRANLQKQLWMRDRCKQTPSTSFFTLQTILVIGYKIMRYPSCGKVLWWVPLVVVLVGSLLVVYLNDHFCAPATLTRDRSHAKHYLITHLGRCSLGDPFLNFLSIGCPKTRIKSRL